MPAPPQILAEPSGPTRMIGRFSVLGLVGRGGLGEVYAAFDPELGRRVALKVVCDGDDRAGSSARLRREATAMARLSHPNVARVFDVGTVDDQLFIAMEFIRGQTLRSWLMAKPRSWRDIRAVFLAAGQGLAAAHREGIVHRDFKPDNVLIDEDDRPHVVDFGLASTVHNEQHPVQPTADDDPSDATQPSDASAGGTPAYMAPEQHLGRSPGDHRSDQFSFCVSLFEALHGRRPFLGRTWETLRPQVLRGDPRAAQRRCPAHITSAINRGLSPDPARRFADMDALLAELARTDGVAPVRKYLALGTAAAVAAVLVAWRLTIPASSLAPTPPAPTCEQQGDCREQTLRARLDEAETLAQQHKDRALALARDVVATAERELGESHPFTVEARERRDILTTLTAH